MFTHLSVIFCLHTPALLFLLKTENGERKTDNNKTEKIFSVLLFIYLLLRL